MDVAWFGRRSRAPVPYEAARFGLEIILKKYYDGATVSMLLICDVTRVRQLKSMPKRCLASRL